MNDLDVFNDGGSLQPYNSPTAPLSPSPDIGTDIDLFAGDSPQLFGAPVPNPEQAELVTLQIVSTFKNDAVKLGLSPQFTQAAISVFRQMANSPVPTEWPTHGFNLSGLNISSEDRPYVDAFANQMKRLGADQESVRRAIYWYTLLVQHLNGGQPQQQRQTGNISEAQNARDIENGMNQLRQIWGYQYKQNLAIVKKYIAQFPASERDFLDTKMVNGHLAGNDAGFILRVFEEATGGPLPSGGALAREIQQIESTMGTKAYTEEKQARLRLLYDARDGG